MRCTPEGIPIPPDPPPFLTTEMFLLWVERQEGQWEMVRGRAQFLLPITRRVSMLRMDFWLALADRLDRSHHDVVHYFGVRTGPLTIRSANVVVDAGKLDDEAQLSSAPRLILHVPKEDEPAAELTERLNEYRALPTLRYLVVPEPLRVSVRFERRLDDETWTTSYAQHVDDVLDLPALNATLPVAAGYDGLLRDGHV